MRRRMLLLAAAALAITPAAAQQQRYLNPQDVAEAQREHAQMLQELGGAETGPRAAYVEAVGRKVGAYSGSPAPGQAAPFHDPQLRGRECVLGAGRLCLRDSPADGDHER